MPSPVLGTISTNVIQSQIQVKVYFNHGSEPTHQAIIDKNAISTSQKLLAIVDQMIDPSLKGEGVDISYRSEGSYFKVTADNSEASKRYENFIATLKSMSPLVLNVDFKSDNPK